MHEFQLIHEILNTGNLEIIEIIGDTLLNADYILSAIASGSMEPDLDTGNDLSGHCSPPRVGLGLQLRPNILELMEWR